MKKFLLLFLILVQFTGISHSHWEDEFDPFTCQITKINCTSSIPSLNEIEQRNHYRREAQLETDRIKFHPLIPSHTDLVFKELFAKKEIMKFYEMGVPRDKEYVEKRAINWVNRWDESPFSWWILTEKASNTFIGAVGCYYHKDLESIEIAYLLTTSAQKKGYMVEGFNQAFIPYVQKIKSNIEEFKNIQSFHAPIHPENERSRHLAEKIGMKNIPQKDYFSESYKAYRKWFMKEL